MNPLTAASRRKHLRRRIVAATVGAAVLTSGFAVSGVISAQGASTTFSNISTKPLDILLGVGADETQRIANWYYPGSAAQSLVIEKNSTMTAGAFSAAASTIPAVSAANTAADVSADPKQSGYYNAHATINNLEPGTTYSYRVGAADGSNWSPIYTFTTGSSSDNFDFLFFGDPQIGSSGNVAGDAAGWAATLEYATSPAQTPNAELLVSGGDQVETANNEFQWAAFADSSDVLKKYTWAATIGNHDVGGKAYEQHNTLPNLSSNTSYYANQAATSTTSGGDYWYMYKDVLFIDLNSNAYANGSDAAHVAYVTSVINAHGADAKWTVLVYHHSIYSPADHANDGDNQLRRTDFTTAFSNLGVDLVLQGHDHSYSRSYSIKNGAKANPAEQPAANQVFAGPGGVIYVTANSASGSKYYDLTTPDASKGGYGADPLDPTGKRHFANSVENQEHVRTYTKISVTDAKLDVSTIRSGDCSAPNSAAAAVNACGVTLKPAGSFDPAPIGSKVDSFSLLGQLPATTVSVTPSVTSAVAGSTTPITLTASVAGGLGTVSGSVSFYDGTTLLGTSALSGTTATLTIPVPAAGAHSYSATFTSASLFTSAGATSGAAAVTVTAPTTTPVTTPVTTPTVTKAVSKTSVKFVKAEGKKGLKGKGTVKVTVSSTVAASGTATVLDGSKVVKVVKIADGKGSAALKLSKGKHALRAQFGGSDTVLPSVSSKVAVKIAK